MDARELQSDGTSTFKSVSRLFQRILPLQYMRRQRHRQRQERLDRSV